VHDKPTEPKLDSLPKLRVGLQVLDAQAALGITQLRHCRPAVGLHSPEECIGVCTPQAQQLQLRQRRDEAVGELGVLLVLGGWLKVKGGRRALDRRRIRCLSPREAGLQDLAAVVVSIGSTHPEARPVQRVHTDELGRHLCIPGDLMLQHDHLDSLPCSHPGPGDLGIVAELVDLLQQALGEDRIQHRRHGKLLQ
jgi:hypothetical protein